MKVLIRLVIGVLLLILIQSNKPIGTPFIPLGAKIMVVIDAGIATESNLDLLKKRAYNYLCVSRTKLKE